MDELLDILNEEGEKTGKAMKSEAHRLGLLHRGAHVYIINSQKQLLLQKRAKSKAGYPGLWFMSAGGHIASGETSLEAAQKEVREELGFDLPFSMFTLLFTMRFPIIKHNDNFIDNEFGDIYLVRSDVALLEVKFPIREVEEVKWINIKDFEKLVNARDLTLVPNWEEYKKLLEYLKNEKI
jgi:isopentenyl-diphosphate delta-isomerase